MHKYKIGVVEYLNTKPLIYEYKKQKFLSNCEFIFTYPSNLKKLFLENHLDIALLPVAAISLTNDNKFNLISDYCIGSCGAVATVGVLSNLPIDQLHNIVLDPHSSTSNELLKILIKTRSNSITLMNDFKNIEAPENNIDKTGFLVIGDKVFEKKNDYKYFFDLGLQWWEYCSMPFVFATWVSNKNIDIVFINNFNKFQKNNLERIDEIIKNIDYPFYDLKKYYKKNISYLFDMDKKKALKHFLSLVNQGQ